MNWWHDSCFQFCSHYLGSRVNTCRHTHTQHNDSKHICHREREIISGYRMICGRRCGESSPKAWGFAISPVLRSQRNVITEVRSEGNRYHRRQLAQSVPRMWGRPSQPERKQNKQNGHLVSRQSTSWDVPIIGCRVCGTVERTAWWGNLMWHSQVWVVRAWLSDPHKNSSEGVKSVLNADGLSWHHRTGAFDGLAWVHVHNWCSLRVSWVERSVDQLWTLLRWSQPAMLSSVPPWKWRRMWAKGGEVQNWRQELGDAELAFNGGTLSCFWDCGKVGSFPVFFIFPQSSSSRCLKGRQPIYWSQFNEECDSFTLNHGLAHLFRSLLEGHAQKDAICNMIIKMIFKQACDPHWFGYWCHVLLG